MKLTGHFWMRIFSIHRFTRDEIHLITDMKVVPSSVETVHVTIEINGILTEPQMETLHQVLAFHFVTHLSKKLQIGRTITLVNTNKFFSENCVSLCPIDITHSVILFNINQNLWPESRILYSLPEYRKLILQINSGFLSWTLFCQIWQYCVNLSYKKNVTPSGNRTRVLWYQVQHYPFYTNLAFAAWEIFKLFFWLEELPSLLLHFPCNHNKN